MKRAAASTIAGPSPKNYIPNPSNTDPQSTSSHSIAPNIREVSRSTLNINPKRNQEHLFFTRRDSLPPPLSKHDGFCGLQMTEMDQNTRDKENWFYAFTKYGSARNLKTMEDFSFEADAHWKTIFALIKKHQFDINQTDVDGKTGLIRSVEMLDIKLFNLLIHQHNVKVDVQDAHGYNALMHAVHHNCKAMVDKLLSFDSAQSDINAQGRDGKTALILAVEFGDDSENSTVQGKNVGQGADASSAHIQIKNNKIIDTLLRNDYIKLYLKDMLGKNAKDYAQSRQREKMIARLAQYESGRTDLHIAIEQLSEKNFNELLAQANNNKLEVKDYRGYTPYLCAAKYGRTNFFTTLFNRAENGREALDCDGNSALMLAAAHGHADIVVFLIDPKNKQNINHRNQQGHNAFICAASGGHELIAKLLIGSSELNVGNAQGCTAYLCAAKLGQIDLFKILFKNSQVNRKVVDHENNSALSLASYHGHINIVEFIITSEKYKDLKNKYINTALTCAADSDHENLVASLLNLVDMNDHSIDLNTIYFKVAKQGSINIFKLLYNNKKINRLAYDSEGNSDLSVASANGNSDIVKFLINNKININHQNKKGETALICAVNYNQPFIVKILIANKKINCNIKNASNHTALDLAKSNQFHKIVKILRQASFP